MFVKISVRFHQATNSRIIFKDNMVGRGCGQLKKYGFHQTNTFSGQKSYVKTKKRIPKSNPAEFNIVSGCLIKIKINHSPRTPTVVYKVTYTYS